MYDVGFWFNGIAKMLWYLLLVIDSDYSIEALYSSVYSLEQCISCLRQFIPICSSSYYCKQPISKLATLLMATCLGSENMNIMLEVTALLECFVNVREFY